MKEDENYAGVCVYMWLLLCSLWASQPFLLLVIKSTVAITRVIMDISLIYNPYWLVLAGEQTWLVKAKVGGGGVQNYHTHKITTHTHHTTPILLLLSAQGQDCCNIHSTFQLNVFVLFLFLIKFDPSSPKNDVYL